MKHFIDDIYTRTDMSKKTKLRLLRVVWVDIMEEKDNPHKNLLDYTKELIRLLEKNK